MNVGDGAKVAVSEGLGGTVATGFVTTRFVGVSLWVAVATGVGAGLGGVQPGSARSRNPAARQRIDLACISSSNE